MIIYQAINELGMESFDRLWKAKEHIRAQELPGTVLRMKIAFTMENFLLAIDQRGGYADEVEEVWHY